MSSIVTYSPSYTIVPTYECFNRCSYCNFRTNLGSSGWLELNVAKIILTKLQGLGITEILILSGEVHPQSKQRKAWFNLIYSLGELALSMGFFPHTNVGPLLYQEMKQLKEVNVSMGLMIEQITPKLLTTVHRHAPSKLPATRWQQLEWSGQLKIPFTTGLLLGIGESESDWKDSLSAIAYIHQSWGHIQEVILQPYSPGGSKYTSFDLPKAVTLAREILPIDITIQIPPNLIHDSATLLQCIELGARDLGGISPKDEINPTYPHQAINQLQTVLELSEWQLLPRLPVYPQYLTQDWLSSQVIDHLIKYGISVK